MLLTLTMHEIIGGRYCHQKAEAVRRCFMLCLLTGARVSSARDKSSGETVSRRHSEIPSPDDPHHQHQGGDTHQHSDHCRLVLCVGNY